MLVLTRKANEKIRIGDSITISIIRTKGNSVSIGIEAPREVRVLRAELAARDAASAAERTEPSEPQPVAASASAAEGSGEEAGSDSSNGPLPSSRPLRRVMETVLALHAV